MTITSNAPGNLFAAGSEMKFTVQATGSVHYTVTDYFGRLVAEGDATGIIAVPKQNPGWYQITCTSGEDKATTSIGVLINRKHAKLPANGRVCTDAASAWLIRNEAFRKPFAKIIRMAGIPCVRERFSWSEVAQQPDKYVWGKYQATADAFSAEGVEVDQIWHDSPEWSRPGSEGRCPDDLRTVYRFTKDAAAHFAPQIQSWEVWNEPDISFWPQLGDRFAGFQKAAYLGLKDGNPKAVVLNGAICIGVTDFVRNVFESGITDYFDAFNWHIYAPPTAYAKTMKDHLDLLARYGADKRPVWLTECGIRLVGAEGEDKRFLSMDDQRKQAQFIPQAAALALASGTDRFFFFVTPQYLENGVQFGVLRDDLTPNPAFIALSAAANMLGESTYLGKFKSGSDIGAHVFSTPRGNVMVAWTDKDAELTVPTEKPSVIVADIFGGEKRVHVTNGKVTVKVGQDAVYLVNIGTEALATLAREPRPAGEMPSLKPSRTVVTSHADLEIDKGKNTYLVHSAAPFPYTVEVYNFDEKATSAGTVEIQAPQGWGVDIPEKHVTVGPMGREVLTFQVTPSPEGLGVQKVWARPHFRDKSVRPSVSYFATDPATLKPISRKPLDWTNAADWTPAASENGTVTMTNPAPGTLRFDARFGEQKDRWAYPELKIEPTDMREFDGIAFDLKAFVDDPDSAIRMMLVESGDAPHPHYMTGTTPSAAARRVVFLFRDMKLLDFMAPDPNHRLDLDQIFSVKLGLNTKLDSLSFEVSNPELVKFKG